ncbi:MAG: OmpA family protein [Planctomycetes bacterium]|nr:OmpA family protein [Planctomycetota bacterium]
MRVGWQLLTLMVVTLLAVAGCHQTQPLFVPSAQQQAQLEQVRQQQLAAAQQQQGLQSATASMDRINQEKERLLATSRQDVQRLEAHVAALSNKLKETAGDLVRERNDKLALQKKYEDMVASNRRTGSVAITSNSSHGIDLVAVEIRGVDVRRDGDVIRVTLPARELFTPGATQLSPGAGNLLDTVTIELARAYPRQLIGVEGHCDAGGTLPAGINAQQFTTSRAMAVYNHCLGRGQLRAEQLHVAGYGGNNPVYSNATPAGREANQRIELVVYPETVRATR